jgi:hypothetical protein
MATHTWTVDTANSPWVYSDGTSTTISGTTQDFALTFDDKGDGGLYYGAGVNNSMALADGNVLKIRMDPAFTFFASGTDGAANINAGSIWVSINDDAYEEVKIVSMTLADADGTGVDNVTSITFEYPGKPYRWTWATIKTA